MEIQVTTEQILSCTVGQLEHNFSEKGIEFEEVKKFCTYLENNIEMAQKKRKFILNIQAVEKFIVLMIGGNILNIF